MSEKRIHPGYFFIILLGIFKLKVVQTLTIDKTWLWFLFQGELSL